MSKRKLPKEKEKHVTLLETDHDKLRKLAKLQKRTMRNTVVVLVDEALKKMGEL